MQKHAKRLLCALAALCALVAGSLFLSATAAEASTRPTISGSFRPIGDDPSVAWVQQDLFSDLIYGVNPGGGANILVSITDGTTSFVDLPAILSVGGLFWDHIGATEGDLSGMGVKLIYAGTDPLTVYGNTYLAGTLLAELGTPNGSPQIVGHFINLSGPETTGLFETENYAGYSYAVLDTLPTFHPGAKGRPHVDPGSSQLSGVFSISAEPEPGTWALMIMGFGLTGVLLRRRTLV